MDSENVTRLRKMQREPLHCLTLFSREPPGIYPLDRQSKTLLISEPEAVAEILTDENERFSKGALPTRARIITGDGTATSWFPQDGAAHYGSFYDLENWRRAKRTAVSKALGGPPLDDWFDSAGQLAQEASADWRNGQVVDIYSVVHTLFFRLSMTHLFKCPVSAEALQANVVIRQSAGAVDRHLRSSWGDWIQYFDRLHVPSVEHWRLVPGAHFATLHHRRAAIELLAGRILEAARSDQASPLLKQVMSLQPADGRQSLYAQRSALIGLLLASYENSAATIAWLIWCLATHQHWQSQSALEINTHPSLGSTISTLKHHAPSLWNCLQETLRLYPPVWSMGRRLECDGQIAAINLKAGSAVLISPWLQHRHHRLWNEPNEFDPARFIRLPNPERGIFLPFGGGDHSCPAEVIARLSICAVMAQWLKTWRFLLAPHYPTPKPMLGLTQRPQGAVWLQLTASD